MPTFFLTVSVKPASGLVNLYARQTCGGHNSSWWLTIYLPYIIRLFFVLEELKVDLTSVNAC